MHGNLLSGSRPRAVLFSAALTLGAFIPALSAYESTWFRDNMGVGLNYGNHFEAKGKKTKTATVDIPVVTREQFRAIRAAGFKHVRLPVCWGYRVNWGATVTINATFKQTVRTSVENALAEDLIVILNTHHEDWFQKYYGKQNNVPIRFDATLKDYVTTGTGLQTPMKIYKDIWKEIMNTFDQDYRYDKIIFEGLNEPHSESADPSDPFGFTDAEVNTLNQETFNIIQDNPNDYAGNSYARVYSLTVNNMNNSKSMKVLELPTRTGWSDTATRARSIITIHYYFNLNWTHWAKTVKNTWGSLADYTDVATRFEEINANDAANFNPGARNQALVGVPVNIGEFGVAHDADVNTPTDPVTGEVNPDSRGAGNDQDNDDVLEWFRVVSAFAKKYNYQATAWDDNGYFKIFNRNAGSFDWSASGESAMVGEIWKQILLFERQWTLMNVAAPALNLAAAGTTGAEAWELKTDNAGDTKQRFAFVVDPFGSYSDTNIANTLKFIRYPALKNVGSGRYLDVANQTVLNNANALRNFNGANDGNLDHYVFPSYTGSGAFALIVPVPSATTYPQPTAGTKVIDFVAVTDGEDGVLYDFETVNQNSQRWVLELVP